MFSRRLSPFDDLNSRDAQLFRGLPFLDGLGVLPPSSEPDEDSASPAALELSVKSLMVSKDQDGSVPA